jgi:cytochrome c-type biogenesis protein CcmF
VLSEYVQGSKVTMGAPFFNRVAVPIGLFLLLLTGVGPLLAWRATSLRSIRKNFVLPCTAIVGSAIILMISGLRPWSAPSDDLEGQLYALVCFSIGAGVFVAILAEFLRGANVVRTQTGKNLVASAYTLTLRNNRRYGGYLVHFGIVALFAGLAGSAFNQSQELEVGFGDSLTIGNYKLVCQSYTQDSNANYDTDFALLDVYRGGKKIAQMTPEKRFYNASQTTSTIVAIHSTPLRDLYVVFEGRNPETNRPIIKVFLNPLVSWIWVGVAIVFAGTLLALAPGLRLALAARPVATAVPSRTLQPVGGD